MRRIFCTLCAVGLLMVGGCGSDGPEPIELESHTNSVGMKFLLVPAGEFQMGCGEDEQQLREAMPGAKSVGERPQHTVRLSKPYYLSVTEVTQEQYQKVMGSNPSQNKNPKNPVDGVSWDEAVAFCQRLSDMDKRTYRLPTEAEFENACRAGTTTRWCSGDEPSSLSEYAWFKANSDGKTHPVSEKKANLWGFCDMHGNVAEWVQDWFEAEMYQASLATDPTGPITGSGRVLRGGHMASPHEDCRSTRRINLLPRTQEPGIGFRVALDP